MKNIFNLLIISILPLNIFAQSPDFAQGKTPKAIFVIVDGIPTDVIDKLHPPVLDSIAKVGGYAHAHVGGEKGQYSETPTISAVGYNSLLTGTWVNKHNVWGNDIKAPNYHYPTIFRLFKTQFPSKKTAIFSSWTDNRTKLVGENLPQTNNLQLTYHFDGLELDTVQFPHDKESQYMQKIDEAVAKNAAEYIRKESPDLSWVYLEFTDDMGHKFGDSPQFYEAIMKMDEKMGYLWQAIKYREQHFNENWVIYITTDHGRDAKTGKNHGGQSDRERSTWIVTNANNLNNYFQKNNPAIVDIMPSLALHLGITIPTENKMEIDGVPLVGELSAHSASSSLVDNKLNIHWESVEKSGNAKIWVATTNEFQNGGKDNYQLLATVPIKNNEAKIDVKKLPSKFYKIAIEMPNNWLNCWVVVKE